LLLTHKKRGKSFQKTRRRVQITSTFHQHPFYRMMLNLLILSMSVSVYSYTDIPCQWKSKSGATYGKKFKRKNIIILTIQSK